MKVARPVRRAGRRNPPVERLAGRSGPTPPSATRARGPSAPWLNERPRRDVGLTPATATGHRRRESPGQSHRHVSHRAAPLDHLGPGQRDSRARAIHRRHGVPIYFCDPKSPWQLLSPWQRGSNENGKSNGLLRQYFPKQTELSGYSQAQLNAVARKLNGRPRRTLGGLSPSEAFAEAVALTG